LGAAVRDPFVFLLFSDLFSCDVRFCTHAAVCVG
jgi:hypothetical protein